MTKRQFWQGASRWGLITGGVLFAILLFSWGADLDGHGAGWVAELMRFSLILTIVLASGRRNAAMTGPEGYPYSRAVGFVLATMLFSGVAYGMGQYVMVNFIAPDHYDALNAERIDQALTIYRGTPMYEAALAGRDVVIRWFSNPIWLMFASIFELSLKGGILGLFLGAFVKKNPDIFGNKQPRQQ
ncbi:MAG: DUF4199 domain-containing protein [Alistipes sp.]|jgi:hypothetical protein|nr:DUF4199 domain-containing protein [Alistipes sp.]